MTQEVSLLTLNIDQARLNASNRANRARKAQERVVGLGVLERTAQNGFAALTTM